jgi:CRP/FNR family cyclic AMP-dependent transcriptional regulator
MISPERLRRFPHCASAPDELLKNLAIIGEVLKFTSGQEIFIEGNPARYLMFLEEGEIDIIYRLGDKTEIVVDTLVAGDTLSWSALIPPHTLTASGTAKTEGSLIQLEAVALRELCEKNPEQAYMLMVEVAVTLKERLSAARTQLAANDVLATS